MLEGWLLTQDLSPWGASICHDQVSNGARSQELIRLLSQSAPSATWDVTGLLRLFSEPLALDAIRGGEVYSLGHGAGFLPRCQFPYL